MYVQITILQQFKGSCCSGYAVEVVCTVFFHIDVFHAKLVFCDCLVAPKLLLLPKLLFGGQNLSHLCMYSCTMADSLFSCRDAKESLWKYVRFSMYASVKSCERIECPGRAVHSKSWTVLLGGWIVFTARMSVVVCCFVSQPMENAWQVVRPIMRSNCSNTQIYKIQNKFEETTHWKITKTEKNTLSPLFLLLYISNQMNIGQRYQTLHIYYFFLSHPLRANGRAGGQTL